MRIFFFSICLVMTHLWRRLHVTYCQWPWLLAACVDERLGETERNEVSSRFFNARKCCLDTGCSGPLQSALRSESSLAAKFHDVPQVISIQKVVNSQIENNFARALSTSRCARGSLTASLQCVGFGKWNETCGRVLIDIRYTFFWCVLSDPLFWCI